MKRLFLGTLVLVLSASSAIAMPSLHFTSQGLNTWTLTRTGPGTFSLTFLTDSMIVDTSVPSPDPVLNDWVNLSTMNLSNIVNHGTYATGILSPTGNLTIKSDSDSLDKLTASINNGAMVQIGHGYIAYPSTKDDINVVSSTPGYSTVIDQFVNYDSQGYQFDLTFTGSSVKSIYNFVTGTIGTSINGTTEGQIHIIPAPGAVVLGSLGAGFVGWLRRRRSL